MLRTNQHILKYQTNRKDSLLDSLFEAYREDLKSYINLILDGELQLAKFMSSKVLPNLNIKHSQWKQQIYKQASQIIHSQITVANKKRIKQYKKIYSILKRREEQGKNLNKIYKEFLEKKYRELKLKDIIKSKYFRIPTLKNLTIEVDSRLFDSQESKKYFNCWINLRLPSFIEGKRKTIAIKLPIKYYSYQKKKFNGWTRKSSITLKKVRNSYFVNFFYEKSDKQKRSEGQEIAFDQGFYKLLSDSNGNHYGQNLKDLYEKISKKRQGSKGFKGLLKHRDDEINRICNRLPLDNVKQIYLEKLKYVKAFSKQKHTISSKFMNKLQRWSYARVVDKLERLCQENGIFLTYVPPAYTSQTCSRCGVVDKDSRQGEIFHCQSCGYLIDADTNGAINILKRGSSVLNEQYNSPQL